jgi:hypothetical protein
MIKAHFQRQGVGQSLKMNVRNVYAEVHYIAPTTTTTKPRVTTPAGYNVELVAVTRPADDTRFNEYKVLSHVWKHDERPTTFEELCAHVEKHLAAYFGEPVEVGRFIEAYCYYSDAEKRIWPHITSDVFVDVQAVYCAYSDTIRKMPENWCLIAWNDAEYNTPNFGGCSKPGTSANVNFDVDPATAQWRELCVKAHGEFAKSHNQRHSDRENKEWLAWLLSESIKDAKEQAAN